MHTKIIALDININKVYDNSMDNEYYELMAQQIYVEDKDLEPLIYEIEEQLEL